MHDTIAKWNEERKAKGSEREKERNNASLEWNESNHDDKNDADKWKEQNVFPSLCALAVCVCCPSSKKGLRLYLTKLRWFSCFANCLIVLLSFCVHSDQTSSLLIDGDIGLMVVVCAVAGPHLLSKTWCSWMAHIEEIETNKFISPYQEWDKLYSSQCVDYQYYWRFSWATWGSHKSCPVIHQPVCAVHKEYHLSCFHASTACIRLVVWTREAGAAIAECCQWFPAHLPSLFDHPQHR